MKSVRTETGRLIKIRNTADTHPCFSEKALHRLCRIHLSVAPVCNVRCRYCIRNYYLADESRPGITGKVLGPAEAIELVRMFLAGNDSVSIAGIAGPGDPLANDATFKVLGAVHRMFPELTLCVSTNGLLLTERLEDLMKCGVRSLTITMSSVTPETAEKIYTRIYYRGKRFSGREAAEIIVSNQMRGLRNAIDAGFMVKVNSVLIPGINQMELPLIAWLAGQKGADIMNILPLIPQAEFEGLRRPTEEMIHAMRVECGKYLPQMTHCSRCRADACGSLDEDRGMEREVLNANIGEEYCEMV